MTSVSPIPYGLNNVPEFLNRKFYVETKIETQAEKWANSSLALPTGFCTLKLKSHDLDEQEDEIKCCDEIIPNYEKLSNLDKKKIKKRKSL